MKFRFYVDDDIVFQCDINSERCIGYNLNGHRCKRRVCMASTVFLCASF